jgi:hypothetical protein
MNYTPPGEMHSIRKLMGSFKTHFADYAPYPFESDVNLAMYKSIFGDYLNVEQRQTMSARAKETNKKGFFGIRR